MAALTGNYNSTSTTPIYYRVVYYPGGTNSRWDDFPHVSKAERELKEFLAKLDKHRWYRRLQAEAQERQAELDARSREHRAHPKTRRNPERRMQTYDAAMAMRQLRR